MARKTVWVVDQFDVLVLDELIDELESRRSNTDPYPGLKQTESYEMMSDALNGLVTLRDGLRDELERLHLMLRDEQLKLQDKTFEVGSSARRRTKGERLDEYVDRLREASSLIRSAVELEIELGCYCCPICSAASDKDGFAHEDDCPNTLAPAFDDVLETLNRIEKLLETSWDWNYLLEG